MIIINFLINESKIFEMSNNTKRLVFIEGGISCGKSTLLESLRKNNITAFDEPLVKWQTQYVELDGTNILDKFYKDMSRWSFHLEVAIMTTRFQRLVEALKHESSLVVLERSLWTDRKTFAENLYKDGKMTSMEWKIYTDWFETFMSAINHLFVGVKCTFIHLNTSAVECDKRLKIRNRAEESGIPLSYLQQLETAHLEWLNENWHEKVIDINGNLSQEVVLQNVLEALNQC